MGLKGSKYVAIELKISFYSVRLLKIIFNANISSHNLILGSNHSKELLYFGKKKCFEENVLRNWSFLSLILATVIQILEPKVVSEAVLDILEFSE